MMKSIPIFAATLGALASCSSKPSEASPNPLTELAKPTPDAGPPRQGPLGPADAHGIALRPGERVSAVDTVGGYQIDFWQTPTVIPMTKLGPGIQGGEVLNEDESDAGIVYTFGVMRLDHGLIDPTNLGTAYDEIARRTSHGRRQVRSTDVTWGGLAGREFEFLVGDGADAADLYLWLAADPKHDTVYEGTVATTHIGDETSVSDFMKTFRPVAK